MTLSMLKLLGNEIARQKLWDKSSKQIFWTASCLAFFGSLRMGEILHETENSFDQNSSLLWGDLQVLNNSWIIHIRSPKSRAKNGEFVDLFTFKGHNCCPVSALFKWQELSKHSNNMSLPVFMFNNGKLLTKTNFNTTIRELLFQKLGKNALLVSGHSFRAGIPSAIAKSKISNSAVAKLWGRWKSDSYTLYMRLKHDQKKLLFNKISCVLNSKC
jgi:hypothetical protein